MPLVETIANLLPFTAYPYRGTPEPCNLCGSSRHVPICEYDRRLKLLRTVVCSDCGLLRTDPMPTPEELTSYYSAAYRRDYQFSIGAPPLRHITRSRREATERVALLARALLPGARVLDFGSGSGEFLAAAAAKGCEVVGIEPGSSYAAFARSRYAVEVISAPWQEVEFAANSFDVITAHHVIEHLREPVDALRLIARWLKNNGVLYLAVPDMSPNAKLSFQRFHFAHVHGFIPETLVLAGRMAGLEPDPQFRAEGTTIIFRKVEGTPDRPEPDPALAALIVSMFPRASIAKHLLGGAWLLQAIRRWRKDVRDTLARHTSTYKRS